MTKIEILNKDGSFEKEIIYIEKKRRAILDSMIDNDIEIFYGCMGGSCGACKCKIVEGEEFIDKEALHKMVYKKIENKEFLPCIAKIKKDTNEKIIIQKII